MNGIPSLPSIEELKSLARRLRARLKADGRPIGHSKALELLAHNYGFKDWNTLHAAAEGKRPASASPVSLGARVRGSKAAGRSPAR